MLRHDELDELTMPSTAGVIHLADWRKGPDGNNYSAVWSPHWEIVSEDELARFMEADRFRIGADARWMAVAHDDDGNVLAWLPGCQVKSWFVSDDPPAHNTNCLVLGDGS